MKRQLYGNTTCALNANSRLTLGRPKPGAMWRVERVQVTITNWVSGLVAARILVDGIEKAKSRQGQDDVAGGTIIPVYASQALQVEWMATANVVLSAGTVLRCSCIAEVNQIGAATGDI